MKNLKNFSKLLAVLLFGFVLTACGNDQAATPGSTGDGNRPFEGQTLTLGVWGGNDAEVAAIEAVRADFEAMTGAIIEWRLYTDYNVQIQADFAAGI
ncbi:MAG: hypothetical protein FWG63_03805, partial [Defluviitaleaceae bacterium]|nr:hypothetical protein [Defluviitaleaceae bacterium]